MRKICKDFLNAAIYFGDGYWIVNEDGYEKNPSFPIHKKILFNLFSNLYESCKKW